MVEGEVIYESGRFTRIDRDETLREIATALQRPLSQAETDRIALSRAVFPHVLIVLRGLAGRGLIAFRSPEPGQQTTARCPRALQSRGTRAVPQEGPERR